MGVVSGAGGVNNGCVMAVQQYICTIVLNAGTTA